MAGKGKGKDKKTSLTAEDLKGLNLLNELANESKGGTSGGPDGEQRYIEESASGDTADLALMEGKRRAKQIAKEGARLERLAMLKDAAGAKGVSRADFYHGRPAKVTINGKRFTIGGDDLAYRKGVSGGWTSDGKRAKLPGATNRQFGEAWKAATDASKKMMVLDRDGKVVPVNKVGKKQARWAGLDARLNKMISQFEADLKADKDAVGRYAEWQSGDMSMVDKAKFIQDYYKGKHGDAVAALEKNPYGNVDSISQIGGLMWDKNRANARLEADKAEARRRAEVLQAGKLSGSDGGGPAVDAGASGKLNDLVNPKGGVTTPFTGPGGTPFKVHSYNRLGVQAAGRMRVREAAEEHAGKLYELQQRKQAEREQDNKARFYIGNWAAIRNAQDEVLEQRRNRDLMKRREINAMRLMNDALASGLYEEPKEDGNG